MNYSVAVLIYSVLSTLENYHKSLDLLYKIICLLLLQKFRTKLYSKIGTFIKNLKLHFSGKTKVWLFFFLNNHIIL